MAVVARGLDLLSCRVCADRYRDNGDGFQGLCPSCADRQFGDEDRDGKPGPDFDEPDAARARKVALADRMLAAYQAQPGIEELDQTDWTQHAADLVADIMLWLDHHGFDPWYWIDRAASHFHAERPEPEPAAPLRLLVATSATQGQRSGDFSHTIDGEILYPALECGHCYDDEDDDASCRSLIGAETGRSTTTFAVAEVPLTLDELHIVLAKAWGMPIESIDGTDIPEVAAEMMAVASRYPVGAVLGKTARRYRRRQTHLPLATPPPAPPSASDDEDEEADADDLKLWTVSIQETVEYEFTVEAADEDEAQDAGWDGFDDSRAVHRESEIQVRLAA